MGDFHENLNINLHKEFITAENINDLFKKYSVPTDFDLLSMDLDYNDFNIWLALEIRPRVVVIEFKPTHLAAEEKVVLYNPVYMWDQTNYYGARILSLYKWF